MGDLLTACPRCGSALPQAAGTGGCPRCLLLCALEPPALEPFGDYDLLEQLGRGSMGVVYRARHRQLERVVALKMCQAVGPRIDERLQRFRVEAQSATGLDHPAIVPVYEYGEYDGQPYYTMKLMEGGSLEDRLSSFAGNPRGAAELVARVARAVHYGHDKAIIHRDLKPANILLDTAGQPYVADFGLAKRLDRAADVTGSGAILGTPAYMAPEQAAGSDRGSMTADVYSLGAIFYELLTGHAPFEGETVLEVLRRIVETEPEAPRAWVPSLDRDLETICLRCLQKDPTRRYGSARELAEDLERYLRGDPIAARPIGAAERIVRWSRRHPAAATLAVAATATPFIVATAALLLVSALRAEVLKSNAFAAHGVASAVLLQFDHLGDQVAACAASPDVVALLSRPPGPGAAPQAEALLTPFGAGALFDNMSVYDRAGVLRYRWPPGRSEGRQFEWRDYFMGARRLAEQRSHGGSTEPIRGAYIGRPYHSEADDQFKFTVSAPVFDAARQWVGVVSGSVRTNSTLAKLELPNDDRRTAVLVAPRDRTRQEAEEGKPLPDEHMLLVHDGLRPGNAVHIDSARLRELAAVVARAGAADPNQFRHLPAGDPITDENHRDPIQGFEGRWLAGLSPVGLTGHVVIVQTRYFGPGPRWGAGLLAASLVLMGLAGLVLVRRGRR